MGFNDQILLENIYSEMLLSEKLIGNTGFVFHRTWNNPEDSDILKRGIQPSRNTSAMYGTGLYCCYDLEEQLKPNMKNYGRYILKGKVDLSNFVILDKDVFEKALPKENFERYLKKFGVELEKWQQSLPYTSTIAAQIWRNAKVKGYNGIVFTGRNDGKVAVIWNRNNFIPIQYAIDKEGEPLEWKKLNPDIQQIKRPYDPNYDIDPERDPNRVNDPTNILSINSTVESTETNLFVRPELIDSNKFYQPSLKKAKIIYVTNGIESIYLPNLEEVEGLFFEGVKRCVLPKLKKTSSSLQIMDAVVVNLKSLEEAKSISIKNTKDVNLPKLKTVKSYLMFDGAKSVNCPSLISFSALFAEEADKITINKNAKVNAARWIRASKAEIVYANTNATKNESYVFKNFLLKESLIQIPLDKAYEIFRKEYEKSTGKSWDRNKFINRASDWEFYGDENGYVAVRRQRSGFVKMVGMAGDNRSKLKGMQDLLTMDLPLWGMVSKEIKDIAIRKGMRQPNFLERQVLKRSIPPEVFGDAKILEYQNDGGVKFQYPDVGIVVKYLVGTPKYYSELKKMFGEKMKEKIIG